MVRQRAASLTVIGVLLSAGGAQAASYRYEVIQANPKAWATRARGFNASGMVAGDDEVFIGNKVFYHGFLYANGVAREFDPPNSTLTQVTGISDDGTVAGEFRVGNTGRVDAFIYKDGVFTTFGRNGYSTGLNAISGSGLAVGQSDSYRVLKNTLFYEQNGTTGQNAVFRLTNGLFEAINNAGTAAGDYLTQTIPAKNLAFLLKAGQLSEIKVPNGKDIFIDGINNAGVIVGQYTDTTLHLAVGLIDKDGVISSFRDPNRTQTALLGIDDAGDLVGVGYTGITDGEAFLYSGGAFTILQPPGAAAGSVDASGVNAAGQIYGGYQNSSGTLVAYLATPQ